MNDPIQIAIDKLIPIFKVVEEVLGEWIAEKENKLQDPKNKDGNNCLQFPVLMGMMAVKTNWTDKQVRVNDPFIRWYVRNHPAWHVTRGAGGGIMKAEDKQKKEEAKNAKIAAKAEMKAALEAEELSKKTISSDIVIDSESLDLE